jgi:diadenosine tetraphosphate (Ap4A) HIT family hydrolase
MIKYKKGCLHCPGGTALVKYLEYDDKFWVVCDVHPLIEGHIEVITKEHISCMGALNKDEFIRYKEIYNKVTDFLKNTYGNFAVFEHGITGQTVFHSHVHFLPFDKPIDTVVPEKEAITAIPNLEELSDTLQKDKKYLFCAINDNKYLVDTRIGSPRFFRDRFAKAFGTEERGNWKETERNEELMKTFGAEVQNLKDKWDSYFSNKTKI